MDNGPVSLARNGEGNGRRSCTAERIKEEASDEIQEYAATTMSELLGWYGYDKVDSACTRALNLDHFTSTRAQTPLNTPNSFFGVSSIPLSYSTNSFMSLSRQLLSPSSLRKFSCSDNTCCSWCDESKRSPSCDTLNSFGRVCSEACIAAGRRAAFEQVKRCDWCRHAQSPISYVDFQDGESQLQFCSDKCLNRYKMNIFCHETQTHLMLQGLNDASFHDTEKSGLITPELWFRTCQSPLNGSTEDDSSPCLCDGREIEPESDRRMCRKKDQMKPKKTNECSKRKGDFLGEHEKKLHRSNETRCGASCLERNDSEFSKKSSQSRRKEDAFPEMSIHVRNLEDLQDKEQRGLSSTQILSSETKRRKKTDENSASEEARSLNSLSTTLLPPVAVLVPYPIPIPIPILVPISTAIFSKLITEREESATGNKCSQIGGTTASDKLYFLSTVSGNDSSHAEPSRKKKRSDDSVDCENERI